MKKFRKFNEQLIIAGQNAIPQNREATINALKTQLEQIPTFEEQTLPQLKDMIEDGAEYFEEDLREMLSGGGLPKPLVDALYYNIILMIDDRFRRKTIELLNYLIGLLESNKTDEEIKNDEKMKSINEEMTELSENILKIPKGEIEKVMGTFLQGASKFTKMKEENAEKSNAMRDVNADPFGEENWTEQSDADMLKKAYENRKKI